MSVNATAADPLLDMPHPVVAPMHELVARVEEIVIDRPLDIVIASAARTKLEDAVANTSSLPSVAGTRVLTAGEFGAEGSRRQVR